MAFRNQLEAANAKNQRLQEQLEQAEEENRQLKEQSKEESRPPKEQRAQAARPSVHVSARRGFWAASGVLLGALMVVGIMLDEFGPTPYEWFESLAYLTASTSLLLLGVLYFGSRKLGRWGLLGWSVAALCLELIDMGLEVVSTGQVASWLMSSMNIIYPIVMFVVFLKPERRNG